MAYPPISTLPSPPSRQDPANFATEADAFLGALPTFQSQVNAAGTYIDGVGTAVDADATAAANSAATAQGAANTAVNASNATQWVSGGSYTAGQVVWSPINFQSFRAKTTHSGITTDPSADSTRWASLGIALQTGNAGKFLTTDGTSTSWATVESLPFSNNTALAQVQATALCF